MESDHPTHRQLVDAALTLFARDGYDATSTRAIAQAAGTNISSIAYHFGGKDGLRLACADRVAEALGQVAQGVPDHCAPPSRDQARRMLRHLLRRIVIFITVTPGVATQVGFLLRELAQPGSPVLDRLYATLIGPRHRALCVLWGVATGADPDSDDTKIAVFAFIGQAVYFRLAQPIVQRRLDWPDYGRAQARALTRRLLFHLDAVFEASDA